MSNEKTKTIPERVVEIIRNDEKTYLEVGHDVLVKGSVKTKNKKGILD